MASPGIYARVAVFASILAAGLMWSRAKLVSNDQAQIVFIIAGVVFGFLALLLNV